METRNKFPGWLAINLGTSNSTVTLFDPIEIATSDILPEEQEVGLLELLAQWLSLPAHEALPGVALQEWEKFINDIGKSLEIEPPSDVHKVFKGGSKEQCLEAIRQIELCLGKSKEFRQAVSKKLYQIYHQVFRIPSLKSQSLFPVVLDMTTGDIEIPSELEITNLSPLEVEMSTQIKIKRSNAIAQQKNGSFSEIISKFHLSPKRYFGQNKELQVTVDGKSEKITVQELIQAALAYLIELTEYYRENAKRRFSQGDFQKAVVTYPTVAPPIFRKQLKELVQQLGIEDVQTTDEATAIVMFFFWREFGSKPNVGIESFKTRCRRKGDKWSQNVLVVDIAGATTDIALIKLTLSDITPSFNDKERGLGGRYYQITPKLLGSSGHLQLGGELITLRVFRLLKVAIADRLLSAIATGESENDKFNSSTLDERFFEGNKYTQGSLLKCIDKPYPETDSIAYKDALDTAEKVIPTRWKNDPQRLQTFYTLWGYAERAKIHLGKKPQQDGSISNFILTEEDISELLTQVEINIQNQPNINNLRVEINSEQFERAAYSVIKESVGIAKGLMESRLADNDENYDTEEDITEEGIIEEDDTEQEKTEKEKVDWLILSGKTCNLDLVDREIYQQFSQSDYFLWNRERITWEPKFSNLAVSVGACYVENLRMMKYSPEELKPLLYKGATQLCIDVQNQFYYLPCNFKRKTQDESLLPIFTAGTELYLISPKDEVAKVRTQWLGIQLSNIIYRQDYQNGALQLWGSFDGNKLYQELKQWIPDITETWFEEHIKIQFEIDYALNIEILICQGQPYYLIDGDGINVNEIIEQEALFNEGKLPWDIAINVLESANHLVFDEYTQNFQKFHFTSNSNLEQQPLNGLISEPLPNFPESGKHTFYILDIDRETNEKKWLRIGELSKPNVDTELPCQYRVSLDENGILRIHAGEVPYLESASKECLKEEGWVFRTQLELQPNEVNIERDPFSGTH